MMQAPVTAPAAPFKGPASLSRLTELRRAALETYIEELISLLDYLDDDADLEDNGDLEPSLGSSPQVIGNEIAHDLELDDCDDEEGGDDEPSMGWPNTGGLRIHIPGEAEQITDFDYDDGPLSFDGSGKQLARILLRRLLARRIKP
ncbi:hypothetical protein [Rhizobium laguerreae]|uniref:hypothetical protein n=1 Tax=Rhizobium laguerreae TaxID=1076926 RepID=UPI001981B428|nr:hypothetical protein [Rhizobium laguerreae]